MNEVQIIFVCQRTISIIKCAQEGQFLTIKVGVMKKKNVCFNINSLRFV